MSDSVHLSEPASRTQRLSELVGRAILDTRARAVGKVSDVVVRLHTAVYPR